MTIVMSTAAIAAQTDTRANHPLSWRARLLVKLEAYFPPVAAPEHQGEHAEYEYAKAAGSFEQAAAAIGGLAGKRVLDLGCGWGGETAWLAQHVAEAVGCDIDANALADAERFKAKIGRHNLAFVLIKRNRIPVADDTFDAVFSTNVFEHVMSPRAMLVEIRRVLKPGCSFVTTFGPLFYSPLGYHLPWVTQVPYAHLLLGHGPILEVRNVKRQPIDSLCWQDTAALNRITFRQFTKAVGESGLVVRRLERIAVQRLNLLARLPLVGNLLTFGIDCHLVKPGSSSSRQ